MNYGAIEQVKNGLVFSGKYESSMLIFNPPHVVIFANDTPDESMYSNDRWHIHKITDFDKKKLLNKDVVFGDLTK